MVIDHLAIFIGGNFYWCNSRTQGTSSDPYQHRLRFLLLWPSFTDFEIRTSLLWAVCIEGYILVIPDTNIYFWLSCCFFFQTHFGKFVWVLLQYCPKVKVFQVLQVFSSKAPHEGYLIISTLLFLESNFNQPVITRTSSTSCTVIEYWSDVCRRSLWPPLMLLMYFQTSLCLYFSTPNVYFPEEKSISSMVRVLLKVLNPNCVWRSTSYVPLDRVFSNIIILPRCNVNASFQTSLFS